jgi:hypothetical protein
LQGEGQEFESPRLHHLLARTVEEKISGPPEANLEPAIEPLLRVLPPAGRPPTSGSLGDDFDVRIEPSEVHLGGPHLNNWNSVRQK